MEPRIDDRVRVRTRTGGCYDGKAGTVVRILNGHFTPLDVIPEGSLARFPYWYSVRFDEPADNGGKTVEQEIFTMDELVVLQD